MDELPMPSDLARPASGSGHASHAPSAGGGDQTPLVEPPSAKLIVRLFLIPLIIVAAAVGVMFLIGRLAGSEPSFEEAVERLKNPGGQRTADYLVGPGAKQRYLDAKTLTDKMKSGLSEPERIKLADELIDILEHHVQAGEGEVQHFVLLALGRVWQRDPKQPPSDSPAAADSRQRVVQTLLKYAQSENPTTRKAAILATVYLAGNPEAQLVVPILIEKVRDGREDLDVRIAAATALGPLGSPDNQAVIDALHAGTNESNAENVELVWSSALSLAELNQADVGDIILKLLDRNELAKLRYFDRETDPKNPAFRALTDAEQQRILINTMIGAQHLQVPAVQERIRQLAASDPSVRVRAAGMEILGRKT
jgi:hypothetical protein